MPVIVVRSWRCAENLKARLVPTVQNFPYYRSCAANEAALIVARFYFWHLPPARQDRLPKPHPESTNRRDSIYIITPVGILVNSNGGTGRLEFTPNLMWRMGLFSKKPAPLTGAPAVHRIKSYAAESGYVYEYFYEGHRQWRDGLGRGVEFEFRVSAGREQWLPAAVVVADRAVQVWEAARARTLSSTERYAIAKLALFQAFDERTTPPETALEVRVSEADVEAIAERLGL